MTMYTVYTSSSCDEIPATCCFHSHRVDRGLDFHIFHMSQSVIMSVSDHEDFSTWQATHNTSSPSWVDEQRKLARRLCANSIPSFATARHSKIFQAGQKIVNWDGVSIRWFLDIFMSMPEAIQCANFGCPLWFVRNNCIPLMLQNRGQETGSFIDFLKASTTEIIESKQKPQTNHILTTDSHEGLAPVGASTVFISYTGSYTLEHFCELVSRIGDSESTPSGGHYLWIDLF